MNQTCWSNTWADIGNVKGSWDEIAKENNASAQQVEEKPKNLIWEDRLCLCEERDKLQPYVDEAVSDAAKKAGNATADCLKLDEIWLTQKCLKHSSTW